VRDTTHPRRRRHAVATGLGAALLAAAMVLTAQTPASAALQPESDPNHPV
jgi:hypothetical protein